MPRSVQAISSRKDVKTSNGVYNMLTKTYDIKKTIKNDLVGEAKREAKLTIGLPESLEEAQALFGDNLWKWARHGYNAHCKVTAANSLIGIGAGDRKLLRQFTVNLKTLVDVMEMTKESAITMLLSKEKFAALKGAIETLTKGEAGVKVIDYTATPVNHPAWFEGDDEPEETEEDEEESAE